MTDFINIRFQENIQQFTNIINEETQLQDENKLIINESTPENNKESNHSLQDLNTWDEMFPLNSQYVPVWIIGLAIVVRNLMRYILPLLLFDK